MADASFDAVIIGAGTKASITAMYLAKYGGLKVGIFDRLHEIGGGMALEEAAPGFVNNMHASSVGRLHYGMIREDFPGYDELGGKWGQNKVALAGIFHQEDNCLILYGRDADPTQEKTASEIARFSRRDAETWLRLSSAWTTTLNDAYIATHWNPPHLPGERDAFVDALLRVGPEIGIDLKIAPMTPMEASSYIFESPQIIALILRTLLGTGIWGDDPGMGFQALLSLLRFMDQGSVIGGTHSVAHANHAILVQNGAQVFTNCEVEKVLIDDGTAKGICLTDGTEVEAKRVIVSGVDPRQLAFRLIGEEYFAPSVAEKLRLLEDKRVVIAWDQWALRERPHYGAVSFSPDLAHSQVISLLPRAEPNLLIREAAKRREGVIPDEPVLWVIDHSGHDKTVVPREGMWAGLTEAFVLPAYALTEKEWLQFIKSHSEYVIRTWGKFAPNITWDQVIGFLPQNPYTVANHLLNMAPAGNWAVIDRIPSQMGIDRPAPELSRNRTPIKNLYATGVAFGNSFGSSADQGYVCYKAVADDLGLRKPWKEKGRPY